MAEGDGTENKGKKVDFVTAIENIGADGFTKSRDLLGQRSVARAGLDQEVTEDLVAEEGSFEGKPYTALGRRGEDGRIDPNQTVVVKFHKRKP